jgi:hypothetical protein
MAIVEHYAATSATPTPIYLVFRSRWALYHHGHLVGRTITKLGQRKYINGTPELFDTREAALKRAAGILSADEYGQGYLF